MLRIKDDVDLKELEKFGFKYVKYEIADDEWEKDLRRHDGWWNIFISVNETTRIITLNVCVDGDYNGEINDDTIYQLTKAGLIEKVGE